MRNDKNVAIKLRKAGKSYQEISKMVDVPKSTLSNWFHGAIWSEKTKIHLSDIARNNASKRMTVISHRRRDKLQKIYIATSQIARKEFKLFSKDRLFVAGLMIYWGEGDSKLNNGAIRVSNSDPLMIKLFYKFVRRYLSEISSKAKIYLVLYPDLDDQICRKYWSKQTGLSLDRFIKSSIIKGKHPTKRLQYGIGTLTINSRQYKEKIITWVSLIKEFKK